MTKKNLIEKIVVLSVFVGLTTHLFYESNRRSNTYKEFIRVADRDKDGVLSNNEINEIYKVVGLENKEESLRFLPISKMERYLYLNKER